MNLGKPILCEKPICKDLVELSELMGECRMAKTRIQMVSQYDYLVNKGSFGESYWDYFRSGNDGLAWDCIQIINHAHSRPKLNNRSAIWSCAINGQKLKIEDMDYAYFWMIKDWLDSPRDDVARILSSHEAVMQWESQCKTGS